jgi:hypothetical protein
VEGVRLEARRSVGRPLSWWQPEQGQGNGKGKKCRALGISPHRWPSCTDCLVWSHLFPPPGKGPSYLNPHLQSP